MRSFSLFALLALGLWAMQAPAGVAHIQSPAKVSAPGHSTVTAVFHVSIDSGFHIQSNHPKLDYLIPSSIALKPDHGVAVARVEWPKAEDHKFSFAADPLAVFEGKLAVPVVLKTGAAGVARLHGTFRYQACNDQLCRPPVNVPLTLEVAVR